MSEVKGRVKHRFDSIANWNASNVILQKGEIGIAEIPESVTEAGTTPPAVAIKVGDGTSTWTELDYIQAIAGDVYTWAKSESITDVVLSAFESEELDGDIETTDTVNSALSKLQSRLAELEGVECTEITADEIEAMLA